MLRARGKNLDVIMETDSKLPATSILVLDGDDIAVYSKGVRYGKIAEFSGIEDMKDYLHSTSRMEAALAIADDLVEGVQEMEAYEFTSFTYLRPNYDKKGSDKWDSRWKGYLWCKGTYKSGGEERKTDGAKFSIIEIDGKWTAVAAKPDKYGWNGSYEDYGPIVQAATSYIRGIDMQHLVENQIDLFGTYVARKRMVRK